MYIYIVLWVIFNSVLSQIEIPLVKGLGTYDIRLFINNNPTYRQFLPDMECDVMYITRDNSIIDEEMPTIPKEGFLMQLNFFLGYNDTTPLLKNFSYKVIEKEPSYFIGINHFPLGFSIKDESMSFIHQLYNKGRITKKGFALYINESIDKSIIFIGEQPKRLINEFQYNYGISIRVNTNYSNWGCTINSISFGEEFYQIERYAYFQGAKQKIWIPRKVYSFLESTLFKPYLANYTCFTIMAMDGVSFQCQCAQLAYFPNLTFTLNGNKIELSMKELFDGFYGMCVSSFISGKEEEYDKWILGLPFFRKYIIYFDYENKDITFYSQFPFEKHLPQTYIIYVMISSLCVINSIILLYAKIKLLI